MPERYNKKIKVGVIFGGRSGEHEVSLVSAASVIKAIDKNKYEVIPIGITKKGQWVSGANSLELLKNVKENLLPHRRSFISPDSSEKKLINIEENNHLISESSEALDVIFPIMHGTFGEDGAIQGLLEMAGLPYVGAGVLSSAVGMDKVVQKQLFAYNKLPMVDFISFHRHNYNQSMVSDVLRRLKFPIFVKPANSGSSVGINKAHNKKELIEYIKVAFDYDLKIIVEQGIEKIREIEISVLGNNTPIASVAGEIVPSNEFYDYDAKYVDGKSRAIIPAKILKTLQEKMQATALKAYKIIDCSGMARVDFFLKGTKFYLSEINTIPGFTAISMYPKLWEASGISYGDLIDRLISLALEKHYQKSKLTTSYQPKNNWYKKT